MRLSEKRYLHHCSFRSEKNQRTEDKLITLMKKVRSQLSPFSHTQVRGDPYTNLVRAKNENQIAKWRTRESGFSLKDKKEQILAEVRTEIHKHEVQADSDRRSIEELNGIIGSQQREIDHTIASDEQLRRDQLFLHEQQPEQNRDLRELISKVFMRWKNWSGFKGQDSMNFREKIDRKTKDTINELTARIQELQNEVNCMNDSRVSKDAESERSGLSHVPSQPASFPPYRDPGGMLSRGGGMLSRHDKPPDIWNTHSFSGNVFVNPPASSSSLYPGGFNPWISKVTEDTSFHVTSERQNPGTTLDPRCQSGPSTRNSFKP